MCVFIKTPKVCKTSQIKVEKLKKSHPASCATTCKREQGLPDKKPSPAIYK